MATITITMTADDLAIANSVISEGLRRWTEDAVRGKIASTVADAAQLEHAKLREDGALTMPVDDHARALQYVSR